MKNKFFLLFSILIFSLSTIFAFHNLISYPLTNDSYLHLGIGKYISENKKIPEHVDISFKSTQPAFEFVAHSWLSDLIFYKLYDLNTTALTILLGLMLISTIFISYQITYLLEIPLSLRFLSLSPALLIAPIFYKIHPFIFMIPLMLLFVYLHLLWLKGDKNKLFLLPLLFILLANLVGGFIFLPIILLVMIFIIEIIKKHHFGKYFFVFVSSVGASLINPISIQIWLYSLTFYLVFSTPRKEVGRLATTIKLINQNYIKENVPSTLYIIFLIYIFFIFTSFIWLLIKDYKKFISYILDFIPYLIMMFFALIWIRFIPLVTFITLPLFIKLVIYLGKNYFPKKSDLYLFFIYLLLLGLLIYLNIRPLTFPVFIPPSIQMDLIEKYQLHNNIMTSYDITDYQFFRNPQRKAFLDAQDDLFDDNETINYYAFVQPLPENYLFNTFNKYNINTVLMVKDAEEFVKQISSDKKNWSLIYMDYSGFLFTRKKGLDSLNYVDLSRNLGFDPKEATNSATELERFIISYPDSILAKGQLASIYKVEQKYDLAEKTLLKIPENKWNYVVNLEMGRIKAAQGLCLSAEEYFLKSLSFRQEQVYSKTVLDLAVLYAGCFGDMNKAKHFFQRYLSFPLDRNDRELVRQLMEKFSIKNESNN